MKKGYNIQILRERRKLLRRKGTIAEKCLWQYVRKNKLGVKFYRQYSVQNYILDFYCPRYRIAIELDGKYHEDKEVILDDAARTKFLESHNIVVVRFKNKEVLGNIGRVLNEIKIYLYPPS